MQRRNENWLDGRNWDDTLNEVRQFLERWYFYVSASGHLYARPLRESVTCPDVQAFLRRLDVFGNDRLPEIMAFDFTKLPMPSGKWLQITEVLRGYAGQIDATSVVISGDVRSGGLALILRPMNKSMAISYDLTATSLIPDTFKPALTAC